MPITVKILLSLVTLGYSAIPAIADFNATHATNPRWTPHARFHVVWQVSSYLPLAVIALWLVWAQGEMAVARGWLATGLAASVYAGFFAAMFGKRLYGGANYDTNGVLPVNGPFGVEIDVNIAIFSAMAALLALAAAIEASA